MINLVILSLSPTKGNMGIREKEFRGLFRKFSDNPYSDCTNIGKGHYYSDWSCYKDSLISLKEKE